MTACLHMFVGFEMMHIPTQSQFTIKLNVCFKTVRGNRYELSLQLTESLFLWTISLELLLTKEMSLLTAVCCLQIRSVTLATDSPNTVFPTYNYLLFKAGALCASLVSKTGLYLR